MSGWQSAKARFEKKDRAMMDEFNNEIDSLLILVRPLRITYVPCLMLASFIGWFIFGHSYSVHH